MRDKLLHFWVGVLVIVAVFALLFLSYKVSGFDQYHHEAMYTISADFANIGSLKPRAPVRIAGVHVGVVRSITLDKKTFQAVVICQIDQRVPLPVDTSAKILTEGILGSNYIELVPGYSEKMLADGGEITNTQPAILLENLIGKFMYDQKK